jgi:hypothetical protein
MLPAGLKHDFSRAPTSAAEVRGPVAQHVGIFLEQTEDHLPEGSSPFAVDDADMINSFPAAFFEVFQDQVFDLFGPEGMQVQDAINRNPDRPVRTHWLCGISF